jgi:hypothetical protein
MADGCDAMTPSLNDRIDGMRDELENHRADGHATTTDVLLLLELIDDLRERLQRTLDRKVPRK